MSVTEFTYCGDLVGVTSLYTSTAEGAYNVLNDFYNTVFHGLKPYHSKKTSSRKVKMFSDTLIVSGNDPDEFIRTLSPVYTTLVSKGILLRGGMVEGRLTPELRITTNNFEKFLPNSDVFARAASLEKKVKGARFLVDHAIANMLIQPKPEWLVLSNYARNPAKGDRNFDLQRSVTPGGDGTYYEILYPILSGLEDRDFIQRNEQLGFLSKSVPKEVANHFSDTAKVFECSKLRLEHRNAHPNSPDEPWNAPLQS